MRPVAGQEQMIKGLNKQSADGADTELDALAGVVLKATIEVHAECEVGGALRARPVPGVFGEQLRYVQPAVVQLSSSGQVEVVVAIRLMLGASIGRWVLCRVVVAYKHLRVGVAVSLAEAFNFDPAATPFVVASVFCRNNQVVRWNVIACSCQTAIESPLAGPCRAEVRNRMRVDRLNIGSRRQHLGEHASHCQFCQRCGRHLNRGVAVLEGDHFGFH